MQFRLKSFSWASHLITMVCMFAPAVVLSAPALPDTGNLPRIETQPAPPIITSPNIEKKEDSNYPAVMPETSDIKVNVDHLKFTGNKNITFRSDNHTMRSIELSIGKSVTYCDSRTVTSGI